MPCSGRPWRPRDIALQRTYFVVTHLCVQLNVQPPPRPLTAPFTHSFSKQISHANSALEAPLDHGPVVTAMRLLAELGRDEDWVALLLQRYLSNTASLVLCVARRVKDRYHLLHCLSLLKNTWIRRVVLDK